jgi:SAM-dependent methyltransferase
MAEWFENFFDGIYAKVLPKVFTEEQTLHHVRIVKRLLRLRKNQGVLDIPCGMGRLTIPLAKMGIQMTGVDLTAPYIRRARRDAKKQGLDVRFVQSDMRNIDFDSEFHAAFNWFGSFGYFSDADNLRFCKRIFRALRPGGKFLVETMNKSWLLANFRAKGEDLVAGVKITHRHRFDHKNSFIVDHWTFSKGRKTERRTSKVRAFTAPEIRALLRAAGFRDIKLFGAHRYADVNLSADPPLGRLARHHRRTIAIATKSRTKGGKK